MSTTSVTWETATVDSDSNVASFSDSSLRITYIVIGVIGLLGNGLVVGILLSSSRMRKQTATLYLVSQSLLDLFASVFIAIVAVVDAGGDDLSGIGGMLLCKLWLTRAPLWSLLMSSTYNLMVLSLERYFRVVHPVVHRNHFSRRWAWVSVVVAWVIGPVYNVAWNWPSTEVMEGKCAVFEVWPSATAASAVGVFTFVLQFVLPLVLMIYTYTRMALVIRERIEAEKTRKILVQTGQKELETQVGGSQCQKDKFRQARDNIVKTLVIVCVCFVLCWTWNSIYIFLYFVGRPTSFSSIFYHFTVIAVFANSCVNPFIYAANYTDFQKATRTLFCRHKVHVVGEMSTLQAPTNIATQGSLPVAGRAQVVA